MITPPGQFGHGAPRSTDPNVDLTRMVKDLQKQVDQLRSTPQTMIAMATGAYNNSTPPNDTTWRPYATTNTLTAPGNGFDRLSWFVWSDSGQTFTGAGILGAQTWFHALSGCPITSGGGTGQSTGTSGGAVSASAVWVSTMTGWANAGGATFNFQTQAYFSGAATANTGNAATNALVIWTKS